MVWNKSNLVLLRHSIDVTICNSSSNSTPSATTIRLKSHVLVPWYTGQYITDVRPNEPAEWRICRFSVYRQINLWDKPATKILYRNHPAQFGPRFPQWFQYLLATGKIRKGLSFLSVLKSIAVGEYYAASMFWCALPVLAVNIESDKLMETESRSNSRNGNFARSACIFLKIQSPRLVPKPCSSAISMISGGGI